MTTQVRNRRLAGIEIARRKKGLVYRASVYNPLTGRPERSQWYLDAEQAISWRKQQQAVIDQGRVRSERPAGFAAAHADFIRGIEAGHIFSRSGRAYKPATLDGYRRDLQVWEDAFGAAMRLDRLSLPLVQKIVDQFVKQGRSGSSVRAHVTALKAMLNWARRQGMLTDDPTRGLLLPAADKNRDRVVSIPEARALIDAATDQDLRTILGLAVFAGLRASEILALRGTDVDWQTGEIHVQRASYSQNREIIDVKSRRSHRRVPILNPLEPLLKEAVRPGWLFPGTNDLPRSYTGVRRRLVRRYEQAEILDPPTLHELRHTCASILIASGANAKAISEIMGHSSIKVTFDVYGHLMPGSRDQVRDLANSWLGDA